MKKEEYPDKIYASKYANFQRLCPEDPAGNYYLSDDDGLCVEYTRSDLVPHWKDIPTDKDGFGLWENLPIPCLILDTNDNTCYTIRGDYDMPDFAGDLERHPNRHRWMPVPPIAEQIQTTE